MCLYMYVVCLSHSLTKTIGMLMCAYACILVGVSELIAIEE